MRLFRGIGAAPGRFRSWRCRGLRTSIFKIEANVEFADDDLTRTGILELAEELDSNLPAGPDASASGLTPRRIDRARSTLLYGFWGVASTSRAKPRIPVVNCD